MEAQQATYELSTAPELFQLNESIGQKSQYTGSVDDYILKAKQRNTHFLTTDYQILERLMGGSDFINLLDVIHTTRNNYPIQRIKTYFIENLNYSCDFPQIKELPNYYTQNKEKLLKLYNVEFNHSKHKITVSEKSIRNLFNYLVHYLSELEFQHGGIEINSKNITLSFLFKGNKLLMVSKPYLEGTNIDDDNIVYSFFIDQELVASDILDLPTFVDNFNNYLSM